MTRRAYPSTEPAIAVNQEPLTGRAFNIQFHSTEDGQGIRTTIFFKGCPMHCPWCHNPEGMRPQPELVWYEVRCIGAKDCLEACSKGALRLSREGMEIDRSLCDACGECAQACPATAMEVMGQSYTVDELVRMVVRDKVFYDKSGGGVTLSGGEVSMQADFAARLMTAFRREGIHVALDTCGGASWETLRPLVELADLVLYDLKVMDSLSHKRHTGLPLELILENARNIASMGKAMWIRTPVIPGYNDSAQNIRLTARFITKCLPTVERYDLLVFNNTCRAKYSRLGMDWTLEGTSLVSSESIERLADIARQEGVGCVCWSGLAKDEKAK